MLSPAPGETTVVFDTPAGVVESCARVEEGHVVEVAVANVPSFLYARDVARVRHPTERHIAGIELAEIYDQPDPARPVAKSVIIFGDGQLDRSPCGTGISAAMAMHHAKGSLPLGVEFTSESIIGTQFRGVLRKEVRVGETVAVEPVFRGTAYLTALQQFVVDPLDPVKYGCRV